jgi:hypothetical protein
LHRLPVDIFDESCHGKQRRAGQHIEMPHHGGVASCADTVCVALLSFAPDSANNISIGLRARSFCASVVTARGA